MGGRPGFGMEVVVDRSLPRGVFVVAPTTDPLPTCRGARDTAPHNCGDPMCIIADLEAISDPTSYLYDLDTYRLLAVDMSPRTEAQVLAWAQRYVDHKAGRPVRVDYRRYGRRASAVVSPGL